MKFLLLSLWNYSEMVIQDLEHSKGLYENCKSTKQKLQALYICVFNFAVIISQFELWYS